MQVPPGIPTITDYTPQGLMALIISVMAWVIVRMIKGANDGSWASGYQLREKDTIIAEHRAEIVRLNGELANVRVELRDRDKQIYAFAVENGKLVEQTNNMMDFFRDHMEILPPTTVKPAMRQLQAGNEQ